MPSEKKQCQNCREQFTIEPEDFQFYDKMKVPPPTFCWQCRLQRRMAWRNERVLFKRTCDATGEPILSIYHPDEPIAVYHFDYWNSDSWDALEHGQNYDFNRPFFEQWKELHERIPHMSLWQSNTTASKFTNFLTSCKDCYLTFGGYQNENVLFSNRILYSTDCMDIYFGNKLERCYDCLFCDESFKLFYSEQCTSCTESYFLYDCVGCTSCFMSSNLRNKSYVFRNEQLSKEEYYKRIEELSLDRYTQIQSLKEEFEQVKVQAIHTYANINFSEDCTGDNINDSYNCRYCFDVLMESENCKFCMSAGGTYDVYDGGPGTGMSESGYEILDTGLHAYNNICTAWIRSSHDMYYCFQCQSCSNCFGCVGLQNKEYCILNKQYSKEEYFNLLPRIKEHMNSQPYIDGGGRRYGFGEFFPAELSPFAYQETVLPEYFSMDEKEIKKSRAKWRPREWSEYTITKDAKELPDSIREVEDNITVETIACVDGIKEYSPGAFRITPQELKLYRELDLPLPRKSPDARHYERLRNRNPIQLWERTTEDGVEVLTPYSPDRPEKIYSDEGYKRRVL